MSILFMLVFFTFLFSNDSQKVVCCVKNFFFASFQVPMSLSKCLRPQFYACVLISSSEPEIENPPKDRHLQLADTNSFPRWCPLIRGSTVWKISNIIFLLIVQKSFEKIISDCFYWSSLSVTLQRICGKVGFYELKISKSNFKPLNGNPLLSKITI